MICRNCGRLVARCADPDCRLGWVHVVTTLHSCSDQQIGMEFPIMVAEPDPET